MVTSGYRELSTATTPRSACVEALAYIASAPAISAPISASMPKSARATTSRGRTMGTAARKIVTVVRSAVSSVHGTLASLASTAT